MSDENKLNLNRGCQTTNRKQNKSVLDTVQKKIANLGKKGVGAPESPAIQTVS